MAYGYSHHNVKKCPGTFAKGGCEGKGRPVPGLVSCAKCMRAKEAASKAKDAELTGKVVLVGGEWFFKKPNDALRFGPYKSASEAATAARKAGVIVDSHNVKDAVRPVAVGRDETFSSAAAKLMGAGASCRVCGRQITQHSPAQFRECLAKKAKDDLPDPVPVDDWNPDAGERGMFAGIAAEAKAKKRRAAAKKAVKTRKRNRGRAKDAMKKIDRTRMHRARDAALDARKGRAGDAVLSLDAILNLMEKVGTERRSTDRLRWPGPDDPKTQAASEAAYAASKAKIKSMISSAGLTPTEFKKQAIKVGVKPSYLRWVDAL